jgi:hypothetical protein
VVRTNHASVWTAARADASHLTADLLCALTKAAVIKAGVATSLCAKLKAGGQKAYLNELKAQKGKSVPVPAYEVLAGYAQKLRP